MKSSCFLVTFTLLNFFVNEASKKRAVVDATFQRSFKKGDTDLARLEMGLSNGIVKESFVESFVGKSCYTNPWEFCIVLDQSGSITKENWNDFIVPATKLLVSALKDLKADVKFSIFYFHESTSLILSTDQSKTMTKDEIKAHLDKFSYPAYSKGTFIAKALKEVLSQFRKDPNPKLYRRLYFFTDGSPSKGEPEFYKIQRIMNDLRMLKNFESNVVLIKGVNILEVDLMERVALSIAGCKTIPSCKKIKNAEFSNFKDVAIAYVKETCEEDDVVPPPPPTPNTESSDGNNNLPIILGAIGGAIVLLAAIPLAVVYARRRSGGQNVIGEEFEDQQPEEEDVEEDKEQYTIAIEEHFD